VDSNATEALRWLQRASEKDYPEAEYLLAVKYLSGVGVSKDLIEDSNCSGALPSGAKFVHRTISAYCMRPDRALRETLCKPTSGSVWLRRRATGTRQRQLRVWSETCPETRLQRHANS
jgi:TPR repeat protein